MLIVLTGCGTAKTSGSDLPDTVSQTATAAQTGTTARHAVTVITDTTEATEAENKKINIPSSFSACGIKIETLGTFRYWLYTPSVPTDNMPLIIYLHSGGGKGDDLEFLTAKLILAIGKQGLIGKDEKSEPLANRLRVRIFTVWCG